MDWDASSLGLCAAAFLGAGCLLAGPCAEALSSDTTSLRTRWTYDTAMQGVELAEKGRVVRKVARTQIGTTVLAAGAVSTGKGAWKALLGDGSTPLAPASPHRSIAPDWIGVADPKGVMGNPNSIGLSGGGGVWRGGKRLRQTAPLRPGQTVGVSVDADAGVIHFSVDDEFLVTVESDFRPFRLGVMLHSPGESAVLLECPVESGV
eukprot:TRINITY_DN67670_c0_g1_i1.p1 TRINITY_DN67670_c0_g1~~TRINITY_DN67670_c0_g1_i1.p1  ORF type:complete len:206 (+),score=38.52 TRINITY_DN67670_c0_g1_i1:153-770(+)